MFDCDISTLTAGTKSLRDQKTNMCVSIKELIGYNIEIEVKPLLAFMVICLVIISEWPPLSHRLL